ncbi:ribosomal-protein-alanine N-acetyltransferase [Kineosphaera limosa]|uniref:N-acetyltransferase domain-containing protein n=1 Tax=Kineosphaera limosa NBRC 100340 TaxID=1184609 RepID=K6X6Z1_9MICO|nr:GNAT family protein [Kineosphaera limosa]NYD99424.1 ribosomal-protein-alanine N-acetyltransferase [Kineosphaera limosa]GAB94594.1 hypothetical protein KILIM_007_00320 [Kineosphaera limosa NBRC 100340]
MSADRGAPPTLARHGERVRIHVPSQADVPPYRRAVLASQERLRPWNPVNPGDLAYHLRMQSEVHRTFLIRALESTGNHDIVGKVNVTNIVRGRALAATLGYDSYDPYAGTGLFTEGLRLVVDLAFDAPPWGMGLHRIEASTQPGNTRSAGVLRALGFLPRGDWPGFLWLGDATGRDAWRDHITYGVMREQWPAPPYAARVPARPALLLLVPTAQQVQVPRPLALARAAAVELGVSVVRDDEESDPSGSQLQRCLGDAVSGVVVLSAREPQRLLDRVFDAGFSSPVVAALASIAGAADIVRLALQARAGAGVSDP